MQILIMRHGEAESFTRSIARDADRQLTDFGRQQAQRAGERLLESRFFPDEIWISPYRRAQQTAAQVLQSLPNVPSRTVDFLTPDSATKKVLEAIHHGAVGKLMLVSHQPLVSQLTAALTGSDMYSIPRLAPASMVLLQGEAGVWGCFDQLWQRHGPDFIDVY